MNYLAKTVVVASIIATHEAAVEFNQELIQVGERRKDIVCRLAEAAKVELDKLKVEYEYRVLSAKLEPFLEPGLKDQDPVRVVRVWVNQEEWLASSLRFGVKPPPFLARTISCIYARVDGVLVKSGTTGADMLQSNVKVEDIVWSEFKEGNVTPLLKRAA